MTVVCIGTGPSLTAAQVDIARSRGFRIFVCNNAYQVAPDAELLYAVNLAWWEHYWPSVESLPAEKWTTSKTVSDRFGVNWIDERLGAGLSTDPGLIHHGHGSGASLVSMAHKKGAARILLLGYDLKYAPDYDGRSRHIGSGPRHFFGEYPANMQHWPSIKVRGGVHVELVEWYRSVHDQGLVELINCTPGSALDSVIPSMDISDVV